MNQGKAFPQTPFGRNDFKSGKRVTGQESFPDERCKLS